MTTPTASISRMATSSHAIGASAAPGVSTRSRSLRRGVPASRSHRSFRIHHRGIYAGGWCRRPALMTRPLSLDLRHRIIRAVAEEGMSRRGAATRFGVAPSTVVEFMRQWKGATGSCEARPQGGRQALGQDRGTSSAAPGFGGGQAGHHAVGEIANHLLQAHGRAVRAERAAAVPRSPAPSPSKKTAHASEQDRPGRGRAARRLASSSA